jgi:hypothetical protein
MVALGDHVLSQEFGQNLGIKAVGLLGTLSDYMQPVGIGQGHLLGQLL